MIHRSCLVSIFFLALNYLCWASAFAGIGLSLKFKKLTHEHGLPGVSVQSVCQDRLGLMWFGVEGSGVAVYDGRNFTLYSNNDRDSNSISNNFVNRIVEDRSGNLWFATLNGLNKFTASTNQFKRFLNDVDNVETLAGNYLMALIEYSNGTLWVGTENGISIYDPIRNKFHNIFFVPYNSTQSRTSVYSIYQDKFKNIWVGTQNNGVYLIKRASIETFMTKWHNDVGFPLYNGLSFDEHYCVLEPHEVGAFADQAWSAAEDRDGNIWIGTQHGLWKIDPVKKNIQKYRFPQGASARLNLATINSLYLDANDVLWCGATSDGLALINLRNNEVDYISADYSSVSNLKSNSIRAIFEDKGGLVWVATKFDGCNIYDRRQSNFGYIGTKDGPYDGLSNEFVMCLAEDKNGDVWIGTKYGGINKWDRKNNRFQVYHRDLVVGGKKYPNRIQAIIAYNNELFVGTDESVEWFDPITGRVEELLNGAVFSFALFQGYLLAATTNGVRVFDLKSRREVSFDSKHTGFMKSIDFLINKIYVDRHNRIWFGSRSIGLFLYDVQKDQLMRFFHQEKDSCSLSGDMTREIMEDSRGNIWVGTKAAGLNRYDEEKRCFVRVDAKGELTGKTIYNILEDSDGNFWMGTHDGIVKYNPVTDIAEGYNLDYGLQGKVYELNAYLKLSDGTMLLGGQNGLNVFRPENIIRHSYVAPMVITKFKVFDEERAVGIIQNREMQLKRKDNYISFEFALLDYSAPLQNQYAYQLVGVDRDWVYSGNRNYVSYTNLPPGKYVFRVKGANVDGIWNEQGVSLTLVMPEPLWMKSWFVLWGSVLVLGIVFLFYYLRIRGLRLRENRLRLLVKERTADLSEANKNLQDKSEQILLQNQELELHRQNLEALVRERTIDLESAKEKAEQSDHLKSAFLANMSHEIRTPLNAILGFSSLLASESIEPDEYANVNDIIQTNGNSLLQLINDILDVSMIEANQVEISKQPFSVYQMVNQIYDEMKALSKTHNANGKVELVVDLDVNVDEHFILVSDQRRIRQVLLNLINNAIKFTSSGSITIGYRLLEGQHAIQFFVRDTGAGIGDDYHKHIFERFRKIEFNPSEVHRGTGLGLSISQDFVSLLGGDIWFDSEVGKGTIFYFNIPLGDSALNDLVVERESKSVSTYDWSGKSVLVAEDEDSNYLVIKSMLKPTGINIVRAYNGQEAVDCYVQAVNKFDIVLMDIKMPIMDGKEAAKLLKQKYDTPIIAQTAFATQSEINDFMVAGFDAYLLKPLTQIDLVNTMARFVMM